MRPGLCRHVSFGELATKRDRACLGTAEMTTDVGDGGANETCRDVSDELRQVVVDGIASR
ncbi:hypothetical protein WK24_13045 [Burkholderia vietnamiensis]|nr:hypothetical protein WK24_13045 [Burkholderia vietnamiensis]